MEKLILNEAVTNWFSSISDGKTDKTQENMYLCRGTCGWVLGGNSYFAFSIEETIFALRVLPSSWWCFSSLSMNRRHQKVSSCFGFRLPRIWPETWQGVFSGINYTW